MTTSPFALRPFDVAAAAKRNVESLIWVVKISFRDPNAPVDPELIQTFWPTIKDSIQDLADSLGEIGRLNTQRQKIRDIHAPQNSSDPATPGAICTGCSVHGVRVDWPCVTWKATEDN